jgi:hypothetical protein
MWIGIILMPIWIRIQIWIGIKWKFGSDRHQNNADSQHLLIAQLDIVHSGHFRHNESVGDEVCRTAEVGPGFSSINPFSISPSLHPFPSHFLIVEICSLV